MKPTWLIVTFISLAALMLLLYSSIYAPLGYSISTYDTQGFINASRIRFPSVDFFLSNRPATVAAFYKLLEPSEGYQVSALSSPAEDIYQLPAIQPGLERVVIAQKLLSIAGWILLAVVVARRLASPGLKVLGGILILAFGFSPAIAEWDLVLLSEPVSSFLFVFFLAVFIELAAFFGFEKMGGKIITLLFFWSLFLILWVFARDTNAYMLLVFILALLIWLVWPWRQERSELRAKRNGFIAIALLLLLFLAQNASLQQSDRWINPFFNNILHNVLPYPDRVAFFVKKGMPISDEVWALRNSPGNEDGFFQIPELMNWTTVHGTSAYMQFLLAYPSWTIEKFFSGVETAFSENRQPFFSPNEERTTPVYAYIGDLLHPKSALVIWTVLIELLTFGALACRSQRPIMRSLFIIFSVFFLGEVLMLFVSIHGDALGIVRHALGSVMPLRLSVWVLPMFILDLIADALVALPDRPKVNA